MSDLIPQKDNGKIIDLVHSNTGIDLIKPFSKDIFLIEVHIAGTTHIDNMNELEPKLVEGLEVVFFREPDNQYDKNAIVVKDKEGNKLGYVPRAKNEILSRLMDAGKLVFGKVKSKEIIDKWVKIEMEIYLKD
jgi:hypothetical protein